MTQPHVGKNSVDQTSWKGMRIKCKQVTTRHEVGGFTKQPQHWAGWVAGQGQLVIIRRSYEAQQRAGEQGKHAWGGPSKISKPQHIAADNSCSHNPPLNVSFPSTEARSRAAVTLLL